MALREPSQNNARTSEKRSNADAPYVSGCEDQTFSGNFTVQWLGESGFGCIASRDIYKHTLILEEKPILWGDEIEEALENHTSGLHARQEDDKRFLKEVCNMSADDQEKLWLMHDQYNKGKKRIHGIVNSNAFQSSDHNFKPCLYFTTAKFNHSCAPNIGYDFDGWIIRLWTTRDVTKGEQLCDCYSDVVYHEPRRIRRAFLKARYNFSCYCVACSPPTEDDFNARAAIRRSDKRRKRLKEIAMNLTDRLGVAFLFDAEFADDVKNVVKQGLENGERGPMPWQRKNKSPTSSKRKFNPKQSDLDLVLEYIDLLTAEGIDHDILDCYEMAYDLAVFLKERPYIERFNLGETCLNLYELMKGPKHGRVVKFRAKLEKHKFTLT